MKKYDQSCSVMPSLPFFLVIRSFYSFQKEKNSDINVTKKAYSDSLHDRKIVMLLLRNRLLVLPLMILSFVYLLSISEMKIRTRDKCNCHSSLIV